MRSARTTTVGIVAAALACSGAAAADAAPATAPVGESLELLDVSRPVAVPDAVRDGAPPSPGDVFRFDNLLRHPDRRDAATRQVLGRFPSTCTVVEGTRAECAGTLVLRDGTIEVTGTPDLALDTIDMTVLGGSGRYAAVSGSARLTPTGADGVSRLVVSLQRPAH
ncbi:hypothetical protein OF117_15645 [Geodermatophilus sp. YIM 151500]|uniref:hypothetical protein n=1 Tax=Geodermatophilus sp. YIM 151500 TaxID=2984531 RepID=UPI0021E4B72C|nr:hypothetical protein [Geodermatophilus sp. YIM 151500]MCV2490791.1 hypothetical protein [Geodermatophilus sp. YIM 151500]